MKLQAISEPQRRWASISDLKLFFYRNKESRGNNLHLKDISQTFAFRIFFQLIACLKCIDFKGNNEINCEFKVALNRGKNIYLRHCFKVNKIFLIFKFSDFKNFVFFSEFLKIW